MAKPFPANLFRFDLVGSDGPVSVFDLTPGNIATLRTIYDEHYPPAPPPPPPLPALTRKVADPDAADRGEPYNFSGISELADTHIEGWRQNIVYMGGGGRLTLRNVRSVKAFRAESKERFQGQGLYFGHPNEDAPQDRWPGSAKVTGCLFGWNGWRKMDGNANGYRHGIYGGRCAGPLDIEDSIFVGNACAGVQVRRGGTIRRCVFIDNGISLLSVAGDVTMEDCVVLGGHRYANVNNAGELDSWTANNAVANYTKLTLRNCLFAGAPGQAADPAATPKQYDTGCIVNSNQYPPHPEWSPNGGSITASKCIIAGWPGKSFAGDRPHDGTGFIVKGDKVTYNATPILDDVIANKVKIPDAVQRLTTEIRGLVT
jgi:hypothetical protein